ncbi:MAG: nSTAND1 domain-containing NTPase [Pyrinomonadaceae bacterium]
MNASPTERRSPYQGLIPYAETDAPFFFGREKETRLIIANMFASPLTLLYGASGVGKSSVLRAGVAHQLRQRDDVIVVAFSTWQGNPVADLVQAIGDNVHRIDVAAGTEIANSLTSESPSFSMASMPDYLRACYQHNGRRFMIILDQFEEYFLYHPQEDTFSEEFPKAVLQADVPVSFLISIREDSLARLDRFEGRIPTLFDNYLRVEHLNYDAARAAIQRPIEQYNKEHPAREQPIGIEPALVDAVLKQVQTGQVILGEAGRGILKTEAGAAQVETPFLQMVMTRMWNEEMSAGSSLLRLKTLDSLGGAERIVRTHLDETMSALSPERQQIAAEVFHYLVTPSGTKIAHTSPDLAEYVKLPRAQVAPALEELASGDTRILRGIQPPPDQPGEPRYEIFHDVLAAAILDWRARYLQVRALASQQAKLAEAERWRTKLLRGALLGVAALLLVMTGLAVWYSNLIKASAEEKKSREAATTYYINGRNAWNRRTTDGFNEAIENFNQALKLDPKYALAYVGLADTYNLLAASGAQSPRESFAKARDASIKALSIDNDLGEAHASLAYTAFRGDWNWAESEREFKQAISINYNYASAHQWYALYLTAQGRFDEAINEARRSQELDRTSPIINSQFGLVYYLAHRFDDAIVEVKKAIELDPNALAGRGYLGLSYAQKRMYKEAIAEFEKVIAAVNSPTTRIDYASTLALSGDRNRAQAELNSLMELSKQKYVSAYLLATVYVGLKDKDRAFEGLNIAFQERAEWMVFLKVDPRFDSLHSDPRFTELLRRMNLTNVPLNDDDR